MISETREENLSIRSLKIGSLLTLITTTFLIAIHQNNWAWGFLIGALLSLFSMFSLTVLVPFLFQPNAPRHMTMLLGMTLFMKLPLYCVGLYLLTHLHGVEPAASVLGILLIPILLTHRAIEEAMADGKRAKASKPAAVTTRIRSAVHTEVVHERG